MLAVVLVGGLGTRLSPLTLTTPKQMLPVAGRPMIEHVVAGLARHGVDRVVLSLGYRDDVFRSSYPDRRCAGVDLQCAVEPEPLGTAGAIRFAWTAAGMPEETFLAVNGDVITDLDVVALLRRHRSVGAEATIHLIGVDDPSRYGVVVTDAADRVLEFVEKPTAGEAPSRWVNAGTYAMEPSVLERVACGRAVSLERGVFPAMAADGTLWAVPEDVYWVDAGTQESYRQVQLDLLDGRREPVVGDVPHMASDVSVGAGARVDRSVVMDGAVVGAGARVDRSVVMDGAVVGAGARVDRSVVMDGAAIGAGAAVCGLRRGAFRLCGVRCCCVRRRSPRGRMRSSKPMGT